MFKSLKARVLFWIMCRNKCHSKSHGNRWSPCYETALAQALKQMAWERQSEETSKDEKNSVDSCSALAFPEMCCSRCERPPEIKNKKKIKKQRKIFRYENLLKIGPWNISLSRWPSKKTWTWPWNVFSACKSEWVFQPEPQIIYIQKHLMLCTEWLISSNLFSCCKCVHIWI